MMTNQFIKSFFCLLILCNFIFQTRNEWVFTGKRRIRKAMMYPGTKWCGPGNAANDNEDLGEERDTDVCCREHDFCPDCIEAGQSKYGLTNTASYTRLHCSCDDTFYKCLKNNIAQSNSSSSSMVGYLYFDKIKTQCYMQEHPVIGCKTYIDDTKRCREYILDATQPKIWQWFDVPSFSSP